MKKVIWPRFQDEILAFTSTRQAGFSKRPYEELNLAYHVGDDELAVQKNRTKLFNELGFSAKNTVIVHQFHSDIALYANRQDAGKGYDCFDTGLDADALFTDEKGLALGIYHADCVPLFFYVPKVKVVGIIHAGEAGSLESITAKTIQKIKQRYHVLGSDIFAFIGPSLKFGHRRITHERALEILTKYPTFNYAVKAVDPEYFLDLPFLNFMQLVDEGVPSANIDLFDDCTYENAENFFSFAREKTTGRMMSFIQLLP